MTVDLASLAKLASEADPLPWFYRDERLRTATRPIADVRYAHNLPNVTLIVAAVNSLPALVRVALAAKEVMWAQAESRHSLADEADYQRRDAAFDTLRDALADLDR